MKYSALVVPFMNGVWPEDFEVTLEAAKGMVAEPGSDLSEFGLCLFDLRTVY